MRTRPLVLTFLSVFMGAVTLSAVLVYAGATPAEKCAAAKNKAAAKKIGNKLKCYQKAILTGAAVDSTCLMTADQKFSAAIAKAESAAGCAVTGDGATIESASDVCVTNIVALTPVTATTNTTTTTSTTSSTSTTTLGVHATLTTGCGPDGAITYTAVVPGPAGNAITIAQVAQGGNGPLSVTVVGNAITVQLATVGPVTTSTANDVVTAVSAEPNASALVTAMVSGTGMGVACIFSPTPLAGGQ